MNNSVVIGQTNCSNTIVLSKNFLIFLFITIALSIGITIYYAIDKPIDLPLDLTTDIDWNKPPCNPDELSNDWKEVTDPRMKLYSNRREFVYKDTNIKIAFDKGQIGAPKFRGIDHWHRYNPFTTTKHDVYVDRKGMPVGENAHDSHIDPNCK